MKLVELLETRLSNPGEEEVWVVVKKNDKFDDYMLIDFFGSGEDEEDMNREQLDNKEQLRFLSEEDLDMEVLSGQVVHTQNDYPTIKILVKENEV